MILYHGSNQLITKIDLSKSKDFKDFGRGFYLTMPTSMTMTLSSVLLRTHVWMPYYWSIEGAVAKHTTEVQTSSSWQNC